MNERLNQIITRTGDDGTSSLADGTRLPKSHPRFMAMGDVDELNSHIGVLRQSLNTSLESGFEQALDTVLDKVQHHLFEIGSELAELFARGCARTHRMLGRERQCATTAAQRIHPTFGHTQRHTSTRLPQRCPPRRTKSGHAEPTRTPKRSQPEIPQPLLRPFFHHGAFAQPKRTGQ